MLSSCKPVQVPCKYANAGNGCYARKDKVWEIHRLNENRLQTMFFWMYELKFTKHCNDNGKIIYKKQITIVDLLQKL